MRLLYLLFVWLHILASAVWIGGMVFLSIILVPVSRRPEYHGVASSLIHGTGVRFRTVGWICLGILLLTGTFNLHYRGIGWAVLGRRRRLRTGPGCEAVAGPNHLFDQRTPRFPDWAAGDEAVAGRFLIS